MMGIDAGEQEAIQLALEVNAAAILLDDGAGRRIAESLGLEVRGTLGILEHAARKGLVDLGAALADLEKTNFRISPAVRQAPLRRNS